MSDGVSTSDPLKKLVAELRDYLQGYEARDAFLKSQNPERPPSKDIDEWIVKRYGPHLSSEVKSATFLVTLHERYGDNALGSFLERFFEHTQKSQDALFSGEKLPIFVFTRQEASVLKKLHPPILRRQRNVNRRIALGTLGAAIVAPFSYLLYTTPNNDAAHKDEIQRAQNRLSELNEKQTRTAEEMQERTQIRASINKNEAKIVEEHQKRFYTGVAAYVGASTSFMAAMSEYIFRKAEKEERKEAVGELLSWLGAGLEECMKNAGIDESDLRKRHPSAPHSK